MTKLLKPTLNLITCVLNLVYADVEVTKKIQFHHKFWKTTYAHVGMELPKETKQVSDDTIVFLHCYIYWKHDTLSSYAILFWLIFFFAFWGNLECSTCTIDILGCFCS